MANKKVFVITDLELGWDCVVAVVTAETFAEVQEVFKPGEYIITPMELETVEQAKLTFAD